MPPLASHFSSAPGRLSFPSGATPAPPRLVGILNLTVDSFFDGGRFNALETALAQARLMVADGAHILDIGGQSTRPGYTEITPEEEIARVLPVLRELRIQLPNTPLSIDTYKPAVARVALEAGAAILNDIHGLQRSPELASLAAAHGAAVIAMHHDPAFRDLPAEADLVAHQKTYFQRTLDLAAAADLAADRLILDPGIGFGKTQPQNLALLARLGELRAAFNLPLLLGASRKSVIAHVLDQQPADERLEGTLATTALAVWQGVDFLRVHDIRANARVAQMTAAIRASR